MMAIEQHAVTAAHWKPDDYEWMFQAGAPERVALVIEEAAVEGFIVAKVLESEWEIENVAISGPARRRGHGTRLVGELLDLARGRGALEVLLEVRASNHAARALYEKWAFVESGRRRAYYSDPSEDAILYRFAFPQPAP